MPFWSLGAAGKAEQLESLSDEKLFRWGAAVFFLIVTSVIFFFVFSLFSPIAKRNKILPGKDMPILFDQDFYLIGKNTYYDGYLRFKNIPAPQISRVITAVLALKMEKSFHYAYPVDIQLLDSQHRLVAKVVLSANNLAQPIKMRYSRNDLKFQLPESMNHKDIKFFRYTLLPENDK